MTLPFIFVYYRNMQIFEIKDLNLNPIKAVNFSLEKDLQKLTEKNLELIFGLKFVRSEFSLHQLRIDTLAFDPETKSFVIIEYKRDKSFSVIDQGYAYLALMLNNKADFILEYNEKKDGNLKRDEVDWSQSRVLFLADSFTIYQQNAINFKDLPIELWEVKRFDNKTIIYHQLKPSEAKESVKAITKNQEIERVSREVTKYSIDEKFKPGWENSKELYEEISSKIIELDSRIEEKINKNYIGFKIGNSNLVAIIVHKSKLALQLVRVDKEDLKDPEDKIVKVPWQKNGWGKFCEYKINGPEDIDYAQFLIKQVYQKFYR